jgi:hypothetical protein
MQFEFKSSNAMLNSLKRTLAKFERDVTYLFGASAGAQGLLNQTSPDWHAIWTAAVAAAGLAAYRLIRDACSGVPPA